MESHTRVELKVRINKSSYRKGFVSWERILQKEENGLKMRL